MGGSFDQYLLNSYMGCHPESLEDVILAAEVVERILRKPRLPPSGENSTSSLKFYSQQSFY